MYPNMLYNHKNVTYKLWLINTNKYNTSYKNKLNVIYQLVSTCIKVVVSTNIKWQYSSFQVTLYEKWLFCCLWPRLCLGSQLTTSSQRQNALESDSVHLSLYHHDTSILKLLFTLEAEMKPEFGQVFLSLFTWSNNHFAVCSYGTEKKGQENSCLNSVLWLSTQLCTVIGLLHHKNDLNHVVKAFSYVKANILCRLV